MALPDGRILVTIDVSSARADARWLAELFERAQAQQEHRTGRPIVLALLVADRIREALTHAALRSIVARELDGAAVGTESRAVEQSSAEWFTTQEAAALLHLCETALTKRIRLGKVPGARRSKSGRGWLVPATYVVAERNR
jgi:hypothetical protein